MRRRIDDREIRSGLDRAAIERDQCCDARRVNAFDGGEVEPHRFLSDTRQKLLNHLRFRAAYKLAMDNGYGGE